MKTQSAPELVAALNRASALTPQNADTGMLLVASKCRALMCGYHARWHQSPYRPVAVERVVESNLFNPATGRSSRTFRVAAKLDLTATQDFRTVLVDHKTCSEDISDPNSAFWRQLIVESQLSLYMLLEWINGRKVDEGMWDVVRKPSISPKLLSRKEQQAAVIGKSYYGLPVSQESLDELAATGRETLEMYEARLIDDCVSVRPQWYFQRRSIPRLDAEIHEYATELWDHGQEILVARATNRHPRNSGACLLYGSPCTYLGICSGHDEPTSDKWRVKKWVHDELPPAQGQNGTDILTNSRIRCFQTCRKMHLYKYELGIERQEAEDREALFFGSFWHELQAAYFQYIIGENNVNSDAAPVSAVGTASNETPFSL